MLHYIFISKGKCYKILIVISFLFTTILKSQTGILIDERDGQSYQTVKIGNQWWMAENLNYGVQINASDNQTNNSIVEKYCYSNSSGNCETYGGLYQWNEAINYSNYSITQGICPSGWHVPSDQEWIDLELYLGMNKSVAYNINNFRGTDQGTQLKIGGSSGFNADMSGYMLAANSFTGLGTKHISWSSSELYARYLNSTNANVYRWANFNENYALSVRCIKDGESINFTPTNQSFLNPEIESSVHFADFDNDGDLDILHGKAVYFNNRWNYVYSIGTNLHNTSSKVFDANNDSQIDFVDITGSAGGSTNSYGTLRVNNGAGFDSINLSCLFAFGALKISMSTADFNNDGFDDIMCSKYNNYPLMGGTSSTDFLRNNKNLNSFVCSKIGVYNNYSGSLDWADYDNDFDNDLLITGIDEFENKETLIFQNNDTILTKLDLNIAKISSGDAIWGDYDSDGDLDIILAGSNLFKIAHIYRNNNDGSFTLISHHFEGLGMSKTKIVMGDMDNDGDYDILMSGTDNYNNKKVNLYINIGNDEFIDSLDILPGYNIYDISLGDYDKDGDLDLLTNIDLFQNNINIPNTPPSVPTGLNSKTKADQVIFSWTGSTDDKTQLKGITYNLMVGTTPGGCNILSPMATGNTLNIPKTGNVGNNKGWFLRNLSPGTYYWSVQAIDASFSASEFSEIQTFNISSEIIECNTIISDFNYYPFYSVDAGDYDNDGDYDLLCSAYSTSPIQTDTTFIYRNDNSSGPFDFTMIPANLPQLVNSSAIWADFNKDNVLDILLSGETNTGELLTDVFIKNGTDSYVSFNTHMKPLYKSSVDVADFDNDGDQDILLTGKNLSDSIFTIVYENKNFIFYKCPVILPGFYDGDGKWADLNNDNYMDIILSGFTNTGIHTFVYFNNGDKTFTKYADNFEQLSGKIALTDINNDQYIDFVINGTDSINNKYVVLYKNNKTTITSVKTDIRGAERGTVATGDYDIDGVADILVSSASGEFLSQLYLTQEQEKFEEIYSKSSGGTAMFFDFDNDNDLDMFISGYYDNMDGGICLNENNYNWGNTKPLIPENLTASQENKGVLLSWKSAKDLESPGNGLSYNIKIGTTFGGIEIFAPMSDSDGKILTQKTGNVQMNTTWRIDSLPLGKYYWSVQAIDQSNCSGPWAPIDSFSISEVSPDFFYDAGICLGDESHFYDNSYTSDSIIAWKWFFGDGSNSTEQNPMHLYQLSDTFDVTLWAFTESGDSASRIHQINVKPVPVVDFAIAPVCLGQQSAFINQSDTSEINVQSWLWDFGNGETSNYRGNVYKTYVNNTTATLTIVATNECRGIASHTAIVSEYPDAIITFPPGYSNTFCNGEQTILRSYVTDAQYEYIWKYNGTTLTGESNDSIVIKGNEGEYVLIVTKSIGDVECPSESTPKEIAILPPPERPVLSDFPTNLCPFDPVDIKINNYETQYNYEWRWYGNPLINTQNDTLNRILESGDYKVTASVNGQCPVTSEVKTLVFRSDIKKPELVIFGPNVWYIGCKDTANLQYNWFFNGQLITDEHDYICMVNQNLGEYQLEISDGTGCIALSDIVTIPAEEGHYKSLSDLKIPLSIKFYPNPGNGEFTLEISGPVPDIIQLNIFNILGKNVFSKTIPKKEFQPSYRFQLPLASGIYTLQIGFGSSLCYENLIIE